MDKIEKTFAEYFRNWDIRLSSSATTLKKPGKIMRAGWTISYVFGDHHLDFLAHHRMTNSRHVRIHSDGQCEDLETYQEFCFAGEEEAYYAHNRKVAAILRAKGLE